MEMILCFVAVVCGIVLGFIIEDEYLPRDEKIVWGGIYTGAIVMCIIFLLAISL